MNILNQGVFLQPPCIYNSYVIDISQRLFTAVLPTAITPFSFKIYRSATDARYHIFY